MSNLSGDLERGLTGAFLISVKLISDLSLCPPRCMLAIEKGGSWGRQFQVHPQNAAKSSSAGAFYLSLLGFRRNAPVLRYHMQNRM